MQRLIVARWAKSELARNSNLANQEAACQNAPMTNKKKLSTSDQNNMAGEYYDLFIVNVKMLLRREKVHFNSEENSISRRGGNVPL